MNRSLFLERVRINIEIFCETIGDFLASTCGGLKRPLMWLAGLAVVMTLRSARKGVQRMKSGGLTAGRHEATYKAYTASTRAAATATSGMRGTSPYGTTSTSALSGYGASNTGTGAYGNPSGTTYGSTSGVTYGNTGSAYGGLTSTTQGTVGYNNQLTTTYGSNSAGAYGSNINGVARGTMSSDQMPRPLSDLIDRHGPSVRVMDARLFHDYGGVHDFYGQVETLQAFEGAGVVEKVLQGPGYNKVLVVDGGGSMNVAIFSKVAAASARQNGWKGVVIHGAIRDAKQVGETPIGCKAMGTNPNRGRATSGSKGSALNIFGMPITTGMWIYADKDGIALSDTELSVGGVSGMPAQGSSGLGVGAGYPLAGGTPGYGAQTTNGYQGGQTAYTSQSFGGSTSGNVMGAGGNPAGAYGAHGATAGYTATGGYGSSSNAGVYGQQGYTNGASLPTHGSKTKKGSRGTTGAIGTRLASDASVRDCVSALVYASLISLMIFPISLV